MKKIIWLFAAILTLNAEAQISRQWAATYNGAGDFNDRYTCIAKDAAGNLYVGGSTVNPGFDRDYLVLKMSASGAVVWNKQFNAGTDGPDEVLAIAVDNQGNIYATGFSKGNNTSEDYLTIKLNNNGDTLWTRRYDFAAEYDQANSVFVDAQGNVYVTGQSDQDSTFIINDDYATLKYSSTGVLQWVKRFNGIGNAIDRAVEVAADPQGNVYITGRSDNGSDDDFVTIKYNASGAQQWIRYDDRGGRDRATALSLDGGNNVYITGRSDNGSNDDYWTLKYSSAGALSWQQAYDFLDDDRPAAMKVDETGNVYITGQTDHDFSPQVNWDYLTIAYNSAGSLLWAERYDGLASNNDFATSIDADPSGTVYVTGMSGKGVVSALDNSIVTISYNAASGVMNWNATFAGNITGDNAGNAVVALPNGCAVAGYAEDALARRDAATVRYNTGGNQQWAQSFNGIGDNNENIRALAVDASGNVYAAGYSVGNGNNRDMAVVKFNETGNVSCAYTLDGSATGSVDDAQGIALDAQGNPLIAGVTKNSGTTNDITLFKLNTSCDTIWTKVTDGPGHGSDRIYDMVKDAADNFYITGRIDADPGATANDNCYTAKLDANGNIIWAKAFNSSGSNADRGVFIRTNPAGDVYVAGRSFNGTDDDLFLIKYNNTGLQKWIRTFAGANGNDEPRALAIDAQGNIIVAANTEEATDSIFDYLVLKFDPNGNQAWAKTFDGGDNDELQALTVDGTGNVIASGRSNAAAAPAQNFNMVTLKYSPAGNLLWTKSYDGGADDTPDAISVNAANLIYLTGHVNVATLTAPTYDVITFILNGNGEALWSEQYTSTGNSSDVPNLIYLNGNDFYVAGSTDDLAGHQRDMLVLKYSGAVATTAPAEAGLYRVFPTPFNSTLSVRRSSGPNEDAVFELTDETGKSLFRQSLSPGESTFSLPGLPQALYYYRIIESNTVVTTGKILHTN